MIRQWYARARSPWGVLLDLPDTRPLVVRQEAGVFLAVVYDAPRDAVVRCHLRAPGIEACYLTTAGLALHFEALAEWFGETYVKPANMIAADFPEDCGLRASFEKGSRVLGSSLPEDADEFGPWVRNCLRDVIPASQ